MRHCFLFLTLLASASTCAAEPTAEELEFFEKDIRPLLVKHCYECHSVDAKRLEASLYLDSRKGMLTGGDSGEAIVPGKPDESMLIDAVKYETFEMPPRGKLPAEEIAKLEKWVEIGAPWPKEAEPKPSKDRKAFDWRERKEEHWSWKPIRKVTPPPVWSEPWSRSPIDRFLYARLAAKGLGPSARASKEVLVRRLYLDLIGLPPTAEQSRAFVNNSDPDAYADLVDELLNSPHFGEKWARHWMDLTRYAESHGHEFDYTIPNTVPYRDYLIRAFNQDLPYDQLVKEHIAGDLLPTPRRHPTRQFNESILGTGFWFFGEATHSPTDSRKDEADRVDNKIDVFSKTFLGLTVSCARCHDHKFDPIPTSDYYALAGFLQGTRRHEAPIDSDRKIETTADQLAAMNASGSELLRESAPWNTLSADELKRYLAASAELINDPQVVGSTKASETDAQPAIIFEDFEDGTYDGWTRTGDAFGDRPATGTQRNQQEVTGFRGKYLVNSYPGTDNRVGTLTSAEFTITRSYINFLIGGGHFKGKTCVNLVIDGKVLRTAIGRGPTDREALSGRSWDVRDLRGKTARIVIVDQQKGGWGHINADHFVFADQADTDVSNTGAAPTSEQIAAQAERKSLDRNQLASFVKLVSEADASKPESFLSLIALLKHSSIDDFHRQQEKLSKTVKSRNEAVISFTGPTRPVGEFGADGNDAWYPDGAAFRTFDVQTEASPVPGVLWDWRTSKPLLSVPGTVTGGLLAPKFQGVLRSPTFELTDDHIYLRMRGKGATVRLIINGYFLEPRNGLLFGGTRLTGKATDTGGEWKWLRLGNAMYRGQKAWLEFHCPPGSSFELDSVRIGPARTPADSPNINVEVVSRTKLKTPAELLDQIGIQWQIQQNHLSRNSATPSDVEFYNQLVEEGIIPLPDALVPTLRESKRVAATVPSGPLALVATDGNGEDEYIFIRGSHENLGKLVPRRMLIAIDGEDQPAIKSGSGRLELAQRLLANENPFPARVMVNRLWHHLFGTGIVPSVDDFGVMGQLPSHPDLLDWLANDFRESGWSIKTAIRQMVMSEAYQQSSALTDRHATALELDPENRLLWRMPVRRMTAEQLRDSILANSGQLKPSVGGSSVNVYLSPYMNGRGRPPGGPLDGGGRRSLYVSIRRNFLPGMMLTFDFPVPFSTRGRRTVSNVPAQALTLMNDPFVIDQAKKWGTRVAASEGDMNAKMDQVFLTALARTPSDSERQRIATFIQESGDNAQTWQDVCHLVWNMKEFLFIR